jgi:hypothetical protein
VRNSTGGYTKDDFVVDLESGRVNCPAGHSALIRYSARGEGKASFKPHCARCPLKDHCTPSRRGRTISIHPQEPLLQQARAEQKTPEWQAAYRADRPVVERKISHLVRRAWGGGGPEHAGGNELTPTCTSGPPPSTGPAWPSSTYTTRAPAGRSADQPGRSKPSDHKNRSQAGQMRPSALRGRKLCDSHNGTAPPPGGA